MGATRQIPPNVGMTLIKVVKRREGFFLFTHASSFHRWNLQPGGFPTHHRLTDRGFDCGQGLAIVGDRTVVAVLEVEQHPLGVDQIEERRLLRTVGGLGQGHRLLGFWNQDVRIEIDLTFGVP